MRAERERGDDCARQVRAHDHDRYLCALFAAPAARRALFALFAFNVEVARVREVVSEPGLGAIRLQWWRDAVAEAYAGRAPEHPIVRDLAEAIGRHGLTRALFERLIDARAADLAGEAPQSLAALEAYAEETSATLVRLALEALDVDDQAAREAGGHVGIAWALVGLMRAVPFHAAQGRLYLPADLLADAGVAPGEPFPAGPSDAVSAVVGQVLEVAVRHLGEARALRSAVPRAALPALLPATLADLYVGRLRAAGNDPFAAGLSVGAARRLLRLGLAAARGRF